MSARDVILAKIRAGLGAPADQTGRRQAIERRLAATDRHLTPQRVAGRQPTELVELFRGFLEGQSATVVAVGSAADVPAALARYLRDNNLPARVRAGGDAFLHDLPWTQEPTLEISRGPARPADEVGLSHALAAVAETGTLVLASGPDNPVTLNYVPETHVVVLSEQDLVGPYEDAWDKVRARYGDRAMPRTVNLISGPSRTADIAGKLVTGAHGPRRLCVILVGSVSLAVGAGAVPA